MIFNRNHNSLYDAGFGLLPYLYKDVFDLDHLLIRLNKSGKLNYCLIEDSPHYSLVNGLVNNISSEVSIYQDYKLSHDKLFNFVDHKPRIIEMIINVNDWKDDYCPLVKFDLIRWILKKPLIIMDGSHHLAILKYHGYQEVIAAVYFYGLKKNTNNSIKIRF